jgi:hypothetical protein
MNPTTLPTFSPPPDQVGPIIRAIADPHESLASVADKFGTTLDALTIWMLRPDITDRINNFQAACAIKTRSVAINYAQHIATMCFSILHEFNHGADHVTFYPTESNEHEIKRRNRETARKAGALLLRLCRFFPSTSPRGTPMLRMGSSPAASPNNHSNGPAPSDTPRPDSTPDEIDQLLNNPAQLHRLAATFAQSLATVPPDVAAGALRNTRCAPSTVPDTSVLIPSSPSELPTSDLPLPPSPPPSDPSHPRSSVATPSSPPSPLREPPRNLSEPPRPPSPQLSTHHSALSTSPASPRAP